jgi:hypothetical protein
VVYGHKFCNNSIKTLSERPYIRDFGRDFLSKDISVNWFSFAEHQGFRWRLYSIWNLNKVTPTYRSGSLLIQIKAYKRKEHAF